MTVSPVSTNHQSRVPMLAGGAIGAASGVAAVTKGVPIFANKYIQAQDTYVNSAIDKAFDRLVDSGITKENKVMKALEKVGVKAKQDFANTHKFQSAINKFAEFTKTHKKSAIVIGAVALAVVGGLIGKAISNKSNKE